MKLHVSNMLLPQYPFSSYGSVILVLLATLVLTLLYHINCKKKKWPPSPPTRPLLGNLHQINNGGNLVSVVTEMAKSCGPVMTLWMGISPVIVINGYPAIWEALVNQASNFAGRPPLYSARFFTAGYKTVISSPYNDRWIGLRKILHNKVLSPFHIARNGSSHSRHVNHLIDKFVEQMKEKDGFVRPFHALKLMAVSFIGGLCFGNDLQYEKENFNNKLEEIIADHMLFNREGLTLDSLPATRYFIISSWKSERRWKTLRVRVLELLLPLIRSARSDHGYLNGTAPYSYLNCLLSASQEEKLSEEEIAFIMYEIFVLGVDSTSTAVEWAIAYLIAHPHIQDRVYQEINEAIVPRGRTVCMEDVGKLPYINAVVKETLRKEAIAPLAMPHQTIDDCKVMGVHIPAKSVVMFNLHGIGHDPQVWCEPEAFMPERFLGHDNDLDKDQKVRMSYLPFGAGRRICAGMDVANVYVPATLANLVKKFEWMPVRNGSLPDLTPDVTSVLRFMKNPLQARIRCR